ncbi:MAG: hypothetical protein RL511_832 [Bacteroidota bacterium]|jgi:hypothetical protein
MRALTKLPGYLLVLLLLQLFACSQDGSKQPVSLDQIRPKSSKKRPSQAQDQTADTLQAPSNFYTNDSASLQIASQVIPKEATLFFLDRFSRSHESFQLKDSSGQEFTYTAWNFSDSNACYEAFYNWLDQAGPQKSSVALGKGNISNGAHTLFIVADRQIITVMSEQPLRLKNWLLWYSGTAQFKTMKYILHARPRKKTQWLQYKNAKLINL